MDICSKLKTGIGKAVVWSGISDYMKLFLFGIDGKDAAVYYRLLPKHGSRFFHARRCETDYKGIGRKLSGWASVEKNLMRDFTLEVLAEETGTDKRALARYFTEYKGMNFRKWKNSLRIEKGKEMMLSEQDMTISEISDILGFQDKSNFYRQFKYIAGCTPGEWKNTGGHPDMDD
ncbi:MAG: helix-turn-helix domain-containing protein [Candidatus Cryptobacteroides sp.]